MNVNISVKQPNEEADVAAGIRQYLAKGLLAKLFMVAILFLSAGRLDWMMGWALVGVYVGWDVVTVLFLVPRSPGLIAERARIQEGTKKWDLVLATLASSFTPMVTWIVAGLDVRFGWTTGIPLVAQVAALVVVALGFALVSWAMASNEFFSTMVRIQKERGHTVASGGPYQFVRHPGYVGAMMFQLGSPIALGSLWALIPSGLSAILYVVRTALEDRTLKEELDGYSEYARRVRYRLVRGLW
jgi:protein-S-isoprenylcysteine O-methyltransferase Ste14